MAKREQQIQEMMESFHSLKSNQMFGSVESKNMPRITPSQWGVLMFIQHSGRCTVKDVAEHLGITSSAATQLIDGLVKSGYVLRQNSSEDRRVVLLCLSKKTKTQVERMKKQVLLRFQELFEVLSDKEFDQYIRLNKKLVERFSKKHSKSI